MTQQPQYTIAPLQSVALCRKAMEIITTADDRLDHMIAFTGRTGTGKSVAAGFTANKYDAYYIECRHTWTKKAMLAAMCKIMGIVPEKTQSDMVNQICEVLALSGKPLIIDEMDYIVEHNTVETIRDIYEASGRAPILLIGEEELRAKLAKWKQFYGRVIDWIETNKGTTDDARVLSKIYCRRGVVIADDLLEDMTTAVEGLIRLMCNNLVRIEEETLTMGKTDVDLATWRKWQKGYLTGGVSPVVRRGR
jgi:hypothetical protein